MTTLEIILLLISILFFIIIIIMIWEKFKPLQWINEKNSENRDANDLNPTNRYYKLKKKFGNPDIIDKNKGGVAIWKEETLKKRGFPWYRIMIKDEQIKHLNPAPHYDFLYTFFKLEIPPNKLLDVLNISKSITYDPLLKVIRARCHFMNANVATIWLAKKVVAGEMKGTPEEYKKAILSNLPGSPIYRENAIDEMMKYLLK